MPAQRRAARARLLRRRRVVAWQRPRRHAAHRGRWCRVQGAGGQGAGALGAAHDEGARLHDRRALGRGLEAGQRHLRHGDAGGIAMALRVLIVDDHAVVAEGVRHLLAAQGLEVIGTAHDGAEGIKLAAELRPDITLLDMVMTQLNGVDAAREILKNDPEARVLVLSMYSDSERVYQALRAGARGYVLKRDLPDDLMEAIEKVSTGGRYLSPGVADTVISDYLQEKKPPDAIHQLSTRERHVLQYLVEGRSAASIARKLKLSPRTIETYKARLMKK